MNNSVKFLFEEYERVKAIVRNPENYVIPKGKENDEHYIKLHGLLRGTSEEIGEEYGKKWDDIAEKIDRLLYPKLKIPLIRFKRDIDSLYPCRSLFFKITLIRFQRDIDPPCPEKYPNNSKFGLKEWQKIVNDIKETNRGFSRYFTNYMTEIYISRSSWGDFGGYTCEKKLKQLLKKRQTNRDTRLRFKKIIRRCLVPLLTGLATANHIVKALFIIPLIFINEFLETSKQDEE
jgi:hypothetical protein